MFSRRNLRHDTAKGGVRLDLRVNEIGKDVVPVFDNSRRGFIT
jgi:hypothetical protein